MIKVGKSLLLASQGESNTRTRLGTTVKVSVAWTEPAPRGGGGGGGVIVGPMRNELEIWFGYFNAMTKVLPRRGKTVYTHLPCNVLRPPGPVIIYEQSRCPSASPPAGILKGLGLIKQGSKMVLAFWEVGFPARAFVLRP